jgi:hypothetical protein
MASVRHGNEMAATCLRHFKSYALFSFVRLSYLLFRVLLQT